MDVVDVCAFVEAVEQRPAQVFDTVPAHVGHFQPFGPESADLVVENAEAFGVALFAAAAQQLHADADAQHGAFQRADHVRKSALAQLGHRAGSLADARKQDPFGRSNRGRVGRNPVFGSQPSEGVGHRTEVARVVVDDRNHSVPLLLGSSK